MPSIHSVLSAVGSQGSRDDNHIEDKIARRSLKRILEHEGTGETYSSMMPQKYREQENAGFLSTNLRCRFQMF